MGREPGAGMMRGLEGRAEAVVGLLNADRGKSVLCGVRRGAEAGCGGDQRHAVVERGMSLGV